MAFHRNAQQVNKLLTIDPPENNYQHNNRLIIKEFIILTIISDSWLRQATNKLPPLNQIER
ncbi:hypothetical protein [Methylomonas albis]|nr:hypothetical protein [Methylomonas albis]